MRFDLRHVASDASRRHWWWRSDVLLVASLIPASINFVSSIIGARELGLRWFGLWLMWRSACQLTSNIGPGFGQALVVLIPRFDRDESIGAANYWEDLANRASWWWGGLGTVAAGLFAWTMELEGIAILGIVILWSGLYISGHTGLAARGRRDGIAIVRGACADALGGIACIAIAITGNAYLFIIAQGIRMWGKGLVQFRPVVGPKEAPAYVRPLFELVRVGFPLTLRGWVQTATQYGDRFLLGALFGTVVAGSTGIGSAISLPSVMIASTACAWILPVMIGEGSDTLVEVFRRESITVWLSVGASMLLLPLVPIVVPEAQGSAELVGLGFLLVAGFSLLQLPLTAMVAKGGHWRATFVNAVAVSFVALVLYAASRLTNDVTTSLRLSVFALACVGGGVAFVGSDKASVVGLRLLGLAAATTVAVLFAAATQHFRPLEAWLFALGGVVGWLGVLWRLSRRFTHRHQPKAGAPNIGENGSAPVVV